MKNAAGTSILFDGANSTQELSGSTVTANLWTGGLDELFQRTDSNGAVTPLADASGSVIALVNSSGSVATTYSYEPFGNTTTTGAASNNPSQYTGRENEGNGLYFYRARYYSPALNRFVNEDPLGIAGSGTNFYAYGFDDPVDSGDPLGLESGATMRQAWGPPPSGWNSGPPDPTLSFPFDWQNYVPTHGNWCGPNWSGGINPTLYPGGLDGGAPPVDALDALCEQHDHMYEEIEKCRTSMDKSHQKRCEMMKQKADIWLHDQAALLPPDPAYNKYRWFLLKVFPGSSPPPQPIPPEIQEACPYGVCFPTYQF